MSDALPPHHEAWLAAHPERSVEWLKARTLDGFDVHHMDGDHNNNDPLNLVLIEASDHMMLHGGRILRRLGSVQKKGRTGPRKSTLSLGQSVDAWLRVGMRWQAIANKYGVSVECARYAYVAYSKSKA